ncbi:uncharacterized protein LOC126292087 [Schistocerca gregaria]|uniref:uncharacterized protein LOC126292087 n=1 Tax=Schistocerca gregaria TaxID=7010 RepID=UPI00211E5EB0|nr:uncharacterized protein LOC126292087 [Schistocerca gregaria]
MERTFSRFQLVVVILVLTTSGGTAAKRRVLAPTFQEVWEEPAPELEAELRSPPLFSSRRAEEVAGRLLELYRDSPLREEARSRAPVQPPQVPPDHVQHHVQTVHTVTVTRHVPVPVPVAVRPLFY